MLRFYFGVLSFSFFIFIVAHQVVLLFPIQSKQQNFAFSFFLQGCFATEINVVG